MGLWGPPHQALSNPTRLRPIPPTPTLPNRVTDCLDCSHILHIPPSSYASALFRLSTLHTRCTLVASYRSTDTRSGHRDIQGLRACCRKHGQASSRFDYVPKAARNCNWTALWKVWWEVCDLWFLCASLHTCASLRWMQLWILSGSMCHLWRSWNLRCLLLQRVYTTREG